MLTAINVPDLSPADDDFTEIRTRHPLQWVRLSGLPAGGIERHINLVRLSRYRAALQAALAAKPESFVVSHLPLMTAAVAHVLKFRRNHVPHLGFAFNFTQLPTGLRYRYMQKAVHDVDQLAVFSGYEKKRYAEYFDLNPDRIVPVAWAHDPPPVQSEPGILVERPYLCAIGNQGRDFRLLMEVARRLGPSVPIVLIAGAENLEGLAVPENVHIVTNCPLARTWRIAIDSDGVLVPLLGRDTCCGHITLVSAKLLGLPIATTYAHATNEYTLGRAAVLQCEPSDVSAFVNLARQMVEEHSSLKKLAQAAITVERDVHGRHQWAKYIDDFIEGIKNYRASKKSSVKIECSI